MWSGVFSTLLLLLPATPAAGYATGAKLLQPALNSRACLSMVDGPPGHPDFGGPPGQPGNNMVGFGGPGVYAQQGANMQGDEWATPRRPGRARGALSRWEARAAARAGPPPTAPAPPPTAEATADALEEDVEAKPRRPRTPAEALDSLRHLGARVVLPPPDGEVPPETSWAALAGATEARFQVEETLLLPLKHPNAFASVRAGTRVFGTDRAAALLFYGPPGTGKTTAARIAAAQAGLPLVYAPLEALMSKWYGKAEQQLAKLFDHCQELGQCVLFLDELDALAGSRSREIDEASRRMLSVLLRRLDGMEAQPETTLIAATNRRTDLDTALLSRFDVRVHFAAPEAPGRAEIFGLYAKHLPLEQLAMLGEASSGLSGRDILDVCRQAERRWVCLLLRGEVAEPPLPPLPLYEAALRKRLESNSGREDGAGAVDAAAASARGRPTRAAGRRTATSLSHESNMQSSVRPW